MLFGTIPKTCYQLMLVDLIWHWIPFIGWLIIFSLYTPKYCIFRRTNYGINVFIVCPFQGHRNTDILGIYWVTEIFSLYTPKYCIFRRKNYGINVFIVCPFHGHRNTDILGYWVTEIFSLYTPNYCIFRRIKITVSMYL